MQSELRIFPREGGEIQRVHLVRPDDWSALDFLTPTPTADAFHCFHKIYHQFLVPSAPHLFGKLVLFTLPEGVSLPASWARKFAGRVDDPLTAAAMMLRRDVKIGGEQVTFRSREAQALWQELERRGCLAVVRGEKSHTQIIPIGSRAGYLTESEGEMKVNSSFFVMDPIDCATPYDHVGTPFGLMVKDGEVASPPLFSREALVVRQDGTVSVEYPDLRRLAVCVGGRVFIHGRNAVFYTRPKHCRIPFGRKGLVIIGRRVAAVCRGGEEIPTSGFVLCPKGRCSVRVGESVSYAGMEDVAFALQVGNSIVRDGVKTEEFRSPFYDLRDGNSTPFPPSMYPLDYKGARAARVALGADSEGKPMILWAEGSAKLGHTPGTDSCGASLSEMAEMCAELGMVNGINLDGGGSAQILLKDRRSLWISDRSPDFSEAQRPVPMGLVVR